MFDKEKSLTERLNELVSGLDERGRDKLLEYADGYRKGFQSGLAAASEHKHPESPRPTA